MADREGGTVNGRVNVSKAVHMMQRSVLPHSHGVVASTGDVGPCSNRRPCCYSLGSTAAMQLPPAGLAHPPHSGPTQTTVRQLPPVEERVARWMGPTERCGWMVSARQMSETAESMPSSVRGGSPGRQRATPRQRSGAPLYLHARREERCGGQ